VTSSEESAGTTYSFAPPPCGGPSPGRRGLGPRSRRRHSELPFGIHPGFSGMTRREEWGGSSYTHVAMFET
jgi:hypothetical protein